MGVKRREWWGEIPKGLPSSKTRTWKPYAPRARVRRHGSVLWLFRDGTEIDVGRVWRVWRVSEETRARFDANVHSLFRSWDGQLHRRPRRYELESEMEAAGQRRRRLIREDS